MSSALRTIVIEKEEDLESFLTPWRHMAEAQSLPFCQPTWMLSWWHHVAPPGSRLRVLIVLESDQILGIAPLWLEQRAMTRRLSILGSGVSSNVDFLGDTERSDEISRALAEALVTSQPKPTSIAFDGIRSDSPWPSALARTWPSTQPATTSIELRMPAPYVPLGPETFEEWLDARSSHFRSRMRRGLRKLDREGGLIRMGTSESALVDLAEFIELHHERWKGRGGSGVLTPQVEAMLREIATREPELLQMWSIDAEQGATASVQVFVRSGHEVSYWLGGFDDTFSKVRPGPAILTVYKAIEDGFSGTTKRLDLGSGDQEYKYEFADDDVDLEWKRVVFSPVDRTIELFRSAPMRLRIAVARRTPPHVKRRLRKTYGALKKRITNG